jgi:hypothetical protein
MENTNLQMNGRVIPVSAYGLADGRLELHIINGLAPYRIELKVNDTAPPNQWYETGFYRVVENIPSATTSEEYNCIIGDLPPGGYKFRIYDSSEPPQMNMVFTNWNATSPPYATLNGSVNALGLPTTVYFEYGETIDYGHTAQYGIVNGTTPVNVLLNLSSGDYNNTSILKPSTLYHYRVVGSNVNGIVYGGDMTFETPDTLPIILTLPATNIK